MNALVFPAAGQPKDKELLVAEGWLHYDLYDKPEPVALALAGVIPFFKKHL